ncbi:hypothetical protein [Streptomyces sp. ODS28]|uniref:hypothetical protein n=1 Tax=Streptomyces sp. ODS28 TaxID=3136688 RepID=UPI0031ED84FC
MNVTAHVSRSSHPHQGTEQAERAQHIVLDQPLHAGRLHREAGDALCRPAVDFYELEAEHLNAEPTCTRCLDRANRYGVHIAHPEQSTVTEQADTSEAELHDTVAVIEQAEADDGTWRGGWIAAAPATSDDVLFVLDESEGEQGALFG